MSLFKSSSTRSLIVDALKYAPSQAFGVLSGLVSISVLTRLFRPEVYGEYALVQSLLGLVGGVTMWVSAAYIRFGAEYKARDQEAPLFGTALWLHLGCLCVVALTVSLVPVMAGGLSRTFLLILRLGVFSFLCQDLYRGLAVLLRTERRIGLFSFFALTQRAISLLLGLGLILCFGVGIFGMYIGNILSVIALLWLLFLKVKPGGRAWIGAFRKPIAREMFFYGAPIALGLLSRWILDYSDRLVIAHLCTAQQIGLYAAPYQLAARGFGAFTMLFHTADRPLAMKVWARGDLDACREFLHSLVRLYLIVGLPLVVLLACLTRPILELAVAAEYRATPLVFPAVIAAEFVTGLAVRFQIGSLFYKKTHVLMLFTLAAGGVNVALNYALIPRFGFVAAALTTFVASLVYAILNIVFARRMFRWPFPGADAVRIAVACLAMALTTLFLRQQLATSAAWVQLGVCGAGGGLVYLAALFVTGVLGRRGRS